jgi:hypothetical protein
MKKVFFNLPIIICTGIMAVQISLSPAQTLERQEWQEDPDRVTYYWRHAIPPDEYMSTLKQTGQLDILQKIARPAAPGWIPIGPTGDFGSGQPQIGRVRSIHIQPITGDYYVYIGASSGGLWRSRRSTGPAWTDIS